MCVFLVAKYRLLIGRHFLYSLLPLAGSVFDVKASDLLIDPNFPIILYIIYTVSIFIYLLPLQMSILNTF